MFCYLGRLSAVANEYSAQIQATLQASVETRHQQDSTCRGTVPLDMAKFSSERALCVSKFR